ncbi:hypothetical protein SAPIO_CDS10129 [Scedosporium apiospermum]|uniref:SUR7 protein n=1 Tax=Pseudallescheria apiosperma TaxID=563466 RepID=A0A084FWF2_PSEDA|nr:uncharacterized protein SAPIO_CDS10129 [Scedosporium apiospermum]KEZ39414.1 hypothetical protein SAPIO_CDS10129 [Scedosporium apiospermum]
MRRAPLGLAGLLLTATALLFLFFLILSGVTNSTPLNKTYFLQADTSGITGARDVTRWTYFYMCGEENANCGKARPAPPFGKAWDANAQNVPQELMGSHGGDTTSSYYFYMWRFGWVFFLIALFFTTLAFLSSFLACCGRIGSLLASLAALTALIFWTIAAVLMTPFINKNASVTFVKARDVFRRNGRDAHIGTYAFAWTWAGWTALLLATLLFCAGIRKKKENRVRAADDGLAYGGATYDAAPRHKRWGRKSKARDSRRVKNEYN